MIDRRLTNEETMGAALLDMAAVEGPLPMLDCGDNSCRSPVRKRGGMRTNGGCRCAIVDLAVLHTRIALALVASPSGQREIECAIRDERHQHPGVL